ncbi:MAG: hypothetical protein DRJ07_17970, partial [Bacteroidetes bacterium]
NNQLFYVRDDGRIHAIYETTEDNWADHWLSSTAPTMKFGEETSIGYDVVTENSNEIFYVAYNQRIYRLYYNGTGWSYSSTNSSAKVRRDSELHYGAYGQLFYVDEVNQKIHALYKSGSNWVYSWLNGSSPKVKPGSGFTVIPELNNKIFYIADNNRIYEMYWSNGWKYSITNPSAYVRDDSKLKYGANGQLFYIDLNGIMHAMYKNGSSWTYTWLNGKAPKVKIGAGFELLPEQNNTIYYTDVEGNIIKLYYDWNQEWVFEKIYISQSNSGGAKEYHNLVKAENNLFYVGDSDSKVHRMQYIYEFPFTASSTTTGKSNNWNLRYTDGADVAYKFYIDKPSTIYATTASPQTTIQRSKIELFDINKNSLKYKYIGSPTSDIHLVKYLNKGYYYIVVDGYDQGKFKLSVKENFLKKPLNLAFEDGSKEDVNHTAFDDIRVFPNPANSIINIALPTYKSYVIRLFSIEGGTIKEFKYDGINVEIKCSDLNNGFYIIQAISDEKIYQKKILIAK